MSGGARTAVHIIGASGYASAELIRLLDAHPDVRIATLESRSSPGARICDLFAALPRITQACAAEGTVRARAAAGDVVFGVDDEAIEDAVAKALATEGLTLGLAESLTGGLAASRLVNVPGASGWFRGSVVSYASEVKFDVLGVPEGPVVSEAAARAMAEGARRVLGADVGLSVTGVAGPSEQDGQPVGTVFVGLVRPGRAPEAVGFAVPGDRARVRQYATIAALDFLRRSLSQD